MTLGDLADKLATLRVTEEARNVAEITYHNIQARSGMESPEARKAYLELLAERSAVDALRSEVLCVCGALK